jgi:hypothetical protein
VESVVSVINCSPADVLINNFTGLLVQLMHARIYSQGKPFVSVIVALATAVTKLIPSVRDPGTSVSPDSGNAKLASCLPLMLQAVVSACDTAISPAPFTVTISLCSMLLMTVSALSAAMDQGHFIDTRSAIAQSMRSSLLPRLGTLPLEVQALLLCTANAVLPEIASQLTEQLHGLSAAICAEKDSSIAGLRNGGALGSPIRTQLINPGTLTTLNRLCRSLDALARHHSVVSSQRQNFIASVTPLQVRRLICDRCDSVKLTTVCDTIGMLASCPEPLL